MSRTCQRIGVINLEDPSVGELPARLGLSHAEPELVGSWIHTSSHCESWTGNGIRAGGGVDDLLPFWICSCEIQNPGVTEAFSRITA